MKKRIALATGAVFCLAIAVVLYFPTSRYVAIGLINRERFENGQSLSFWVHALKDQDESAREQAASALAQISPDTQDIVPELAQALKDPLPGVRVNAAFALLKMGSEARLAVPELSVALKDEVPLVRMDAVLALRKMGASAKGAVPALIAAIQDEKNQRPPQHFYISVRQAAVDALGRIGPDARDAIPALKEVLGATEDPVLAEKAAEALKLIDPAAATKAGIH